MPEIMLEPLPPKEAIKFFGEKVTIPKKEFEALKDSAKSKAFTVARVNKMDILDSIRASVDRAIKDGVPFDEFSKNIEILFDSIGVTRLSPWHVETVFRTNIQTAYAVGKHKKLYDKDVIKERPYLEYSAVDDSSVRESHLEMDGKIYPADHEIWDKWYPPNGYNCRCTVNSVSREEVEDEGLKVESKALDVLPDEGFQVNPAKTEYKPDYTKYSPELRREAGI